MRTGMKKVGDLKMCPKVEEGRGTIDTHTLNKYAMAMRNGSEFPDIIADSHTGLVVDGLYRLKAYKTVFGDKHKIRVVCVNLPEECDRVAYAVKANSKHGLKYSGFSKSYYASALLEYGIDESTIKVLFSGAYSLRSINGMAVIESTGEIDIKPAKRGVDVAEPITPQEYERHKRKELGISTTMLANRLAERIEKGHYNIEDPAAQAALSRLVMALRRNVVPLFKGHYA